MVVSKCEDCGKDYAADDLPEAFAWIVDHKNKCPADKGGPDGD